MKKYFPVLLSKDGEIKAMQHLSQNVKDEICPVVEVLANRTDAITASLSQHWSFNDNQVILDFSWFSNLNLQVPLVKTFLEGLIANGTNVIPTVQHNSPPTYILMVRNLIATHNLKICIRTSNQSGGFVNFNQQVTDLVQQLNTVSTNTVLLLDLGYAQDNNYAMLATIAAVSIQALRPGIRQWATIVVASSSFPEDLSRFVPPHRVYRIQRYEWDIWQTLIANPTLAGIRYGDFGTKYPFYSEAPFAGTISVKYTVPTEFVIYRGELTENHVDGHGQYITHASRLIASRDYSGTGFSWGDSQIQIIGTQVMTDPKRKTGNPGTWVQISQNHHITLLHSLL